MSEPRDFSTAPRRSRATLLEQGLLSVAVLFLAGAAWSVGAAWRDLRQASSAAAEVRRETADVEAGLLALRGRPGPTEALAVQAVASAAAPPPQVMTALAALLPGDVRIEHVSLRYGARVVVDMQVTARSTAAYDMLVERLTHSPVFTDVVPGEEDRGVGTRATIAVSYRGDLP